jgi:hypothetical protein
MIIITVPLQIIATKLCSPLSAVSRPSWHKLVCKLIKQNVIADIFSNFDSLVIQDFLIDIL